MRSSCDALQWWCADRLPAPESLDDDHRCPTVRTDERRLLDIRWCRRILGCCNARGRHLQQFADPRQILPASGIGDQPIVADPVKSTGQDMQQETAHELARIKRHGLVTGLAIGPVILPAKGNATVVHGHQSLIRDRHPMGIARQISQHRRRNERERTRTGRKNPGLQAIQRAPSGDRPPPGTMPWTWG